MRKPPTYKIEICISRSNSSGELAVTLDQIPAHAAESADYFLRFLMDMFADQFGRTEPPMTQQEYRASREPAQRNATGEDS